MIKQYAGCDENMDLKLGSNQIPEECRNGDGDGWREGLFVLIQRHEAKEREPKPPSNIHKRDF